MKQNSTNLFFIGDFHIDHNNRNGGIINMDKTYDHTGKILHNGRPFENLDEMYHQLIKNWNSVVSPKDTIFYMGDLSFGSTGRIKEFVNQLNGEIVFILGNHDRPNKLPKERFSRMDHYLKLDVVEDNQTIILSHYPILSWDKKHHGAWHLHAHAHFQLTQHNPDYYQNKVLDMGCMGWNYTPVSYQRIKEVMSTKPLVENDRYKEKN